MAFTAHAQQHTPPPPQQPKPQPQPTELPPDPFQNMLKVHNSAASAVHNPNPHVQQMLDQMAMERSEQRQKKIASQSAQLLVLAQKLQAEVANSNKHRLSVSVVKEAAEIEKLAKSIRTNMHEEN